MITPKRIVHVSNQNWKFLGARNYSVPTKMNNGFIRNGHDVIFFSDRDIARASNPFGSRKLGVKPCNRKLVEVCKNFEPEIIVLGHADIITTETLEEIRQLLPDIVIFQYCIDPVFSKPNVEKVLSKADHVCHTFMTTAGPILKTLAGKQSGVSFFPNPVDSSIQTGRCHEKDAFRYDLFFAGGKADWADPEDLRAKVFDVLDTELADLRVRTFGLGSGNDTWGTAFMKELYDSKMGLNLSYKLASSTPGPGGDIYLYTSDRISLLMGNGLLTFAGDAFCLSDLYGKDSFIEVSTLEELLDKIRFYHTHDTERKKIASRGYELCHNEFNERKVTAYMLERVLGEPVEGYSWPTEIFYR